MPSEKTRSLNFVTPALSLLLSIGTLTVFHACGIKEDGTWMHCHEAQNAVVIGGLFLLILSVSAAYVRNRSARTVLNGACVIGSVLVFLIPGTIIPMCMMHTMRCYSVMQPFVRILSALIAVFSLIQTVRTLRQ